MKFVIALLLANTNAIRLRQMDAPYPIPADIAFAGTFSDAPVSAGYVQVQGDADAAKAAPSKAETAAAAEKAAKVVPVPPA